MHRCKDPNAAACCGRLSGAAGGDYW